MVLYNVETPSSSDTINWIISNSWYSTRCSIMYNSEAILTN